MLQTVIGFSASGVAADNATMAAGATVTVVNPATGQVRVQVPNLGIDVTILSSTTSFTQSTGGRWFAQAAGSLDYSVAGTWAVASSGAGPPTHGAIFVIGYVTPPGAVPSSGTATYSDTGNVAGLVAMQSGAGALAGDGSLTVNFGTHAVTGSFTGMQAINTTTNQVSIWNNVAISATQSSNQFSGTTSVTTTPGTEFSLGGAASGFVNGELFGPAVNEAAAAWTLSDGNHSAIGFFAAPKQ
jgi:hypothetical protein